MEPIRIEAPYPAVIAREPNPRYARILSRAYAGPESELTAILQYMFGHIILEEYPEVADTLAGIAMTEMLHLELLGEVIGDNGRLPTYTADASGKRNYWDAKDVNYAVSLRKILKVNIAGEEAAIADYTRMIREIPDRSIDALLTRIIADEQLHLETLTKLYEKYAGR